MKLFATTLLISLGVCVVMGMDDDFWEGKKDKSDDIIDGKGGKKDKKRKKGEKGKKGKKREVESLDQNVTFVLIDVSGAPSFCENY